MAIKIFIDQGHNPSGPNTGAEGFGLKEQDITYQVGKELAELCGQMTGLKSVCHGTHRKNGWEQAIQQVWLPE